MIVNANEDTLQMELSKLLIDYPQIFGYLTNQNQLQAIDNTLQTFDWGAAQLLTYREAIIYKMAQIQATCKLACLADIINETFESIGKIKISISFFELKQKLMHWENSLADKANNGEESYPSADAQLTLVKSFLETLVNNRPSQIYIVPSQDDFDYSYEEKLKEYNNQFDDP